MATFGELSDVSAGGLAALARAGRRAHDVVRLCRQARRPAGDGWYDEADLTEAAVEAVRAEPGAGRRASSAHVVVHLPQDLLQRPGPPRRRRGRRSAPPRWSPASPGPRRRRRRRAARSPAVGVEPPATDVPAGAGARRRHPRAHRLRRRRRGARRGPGGGRRRPWRHAARTHRHPVRHARALRPPGARAPRRRRASPATGPPSAPSPAAWPAAPSSTCWPLPTTTSGAPTCSACSAAAPASPGRHGESRRRSGSAGRARRGSWPAATSWSQRLERLAVELDRRASDIEVAGTDPFDESGAERRREAVERMRRRAQRVRDMAAIIVGLIDDLADAARRARSRGARGCGGCGGLAGRLLGDAGPARRAGRPTSSGRPTGSRPPSIGSPRSTASTIPPRSRCSAARWSSSSTPTSGASDGSVRACWSGRCRSPWASISTSSSSSGWPRGRCRRPSTTTRSCPTASGASPGASCRCAATGSGASSGACWPRLAAADRHLLCAPRGDLRSSSERVAVALARRPAGVVAGAGRRARARAVVRPRGDPHRVSGHRAGVPATSGRRQRSGRRSAAAACCGRGAATTSPDSTATSPAWWSRRRSMRWCRPRGSSRGPSARSPTSSTTCCTSNPSRTPRSCSRSRPGIGDRWSTRSSSRSSTMCSSRPAANRPPPDRPWSDDRPCPHAGARRAGVRRLRGAGPHRPADLLAPGAGPDTGAGRPLPDRRRHPPRAAMAAARSPPSCASATATTPAARGP